MGVRTASALQPWLPLLWRLAAAAALVAAEFMLRIVLQPVSTPLGVAGRGVYFFIMAWPVALIVLAVMEGSARAQAAAQRFARVPLHLPWLAVHLALFLPIVWPQLARPVLPAALHLDAVICFLPHALAPLSLLALLRAAAPLANWLGLLRAIAALLPKAALIAGVSALLVQAARSMWEPATAVTLALVRALLLPFFPDLQVDEAARTLATPRLAVYIAENCSGLEGVGMMLAFCSGWLWHLRREFRFPRALLIVPAALVVVFLLNSVRIALLFAIAHMGFAEVARAGFHSQAGWIFFLSVAFLVALVSRQIAWIQRPGAMPAAAPAPDSGGVNPVAAFLLPLLALLAAGMLAGAVSAGFETLYVLRPAACIVVLLIYRRAYSALDWRCGWRGVAAGVLVFVAWMGAAHWLAAPAEKPPALGQLSPAMQVLWLAMRVAAAAITVPMAEELAFRGYLMRRLTTADFASIRLQDVTPVALLVSSVLFGLTHGSFWAPGIAAGIVYGLLAQRTGRIGEAVLAHGVTNALLAVAVLGFDQWQLW